VKNEKATDTEAINQVTDIPQAKLLVNLRRDRRGPDSK
jgi:hypothetical protein